MANMMRRIPVRAVLTVGVLAILVATVSAAPGASPQYVFNADGSITMPDGLVKKYYESDFLDGAKLGTLVKELDRWKSDKGQFRVMPDQHTVEIIERPEHLPLIERVLKMLDKPERQVYVDAKIIEITYDSNFEFGVEFLFDKNPATDSADTFFRMATGTFNPSSYLDSLRPGAPAFQGSQLNFQLIGDNVEDEGALSYIMRAVQQRGNAEILSQPSLLATEKKAAKIITGTQTPVPQIESRGASTFVRTKFEETGIKLNITPEFIGREHIRMKVTPEVSQVTGFVTLEGNVEVPVISTRNADTTVTVRDGETLIIGGLMSTATVEDRTQVPLLGDIPLLGYLFGSTRKKEIKTELVFFITVRIVRARSGSEMRVIIPPELKKRGAKKR
jgi:type II secretory pathway component GspD/PulD (secretin)